MWQGQNPCRKHPKKRKTEVKTIIMDMETWVGPAIKKGSVGSKSPCEATARVYTAFTTSTPLAMLSTPQETPSAIVMENDSGKGTASRQEVVAGFQGQCPKQGHERK